MAHKIISYYETWTPEDVEFGETYDRGDADEVTLDAMDTGDTWVEKAVEFLESAGVDQSSAYGGWQPRTWYTSEDREDYTTADRTIYSYHLVGFSRREEKAVYAELQARGVS